MRAGDDAAADDADERRGERRWPETARRTREDRHERERRDRPTSSGCVSVREPMRHAACSTIATTAGLTPYEHAGDAGTSP